MGVGGAANAVQIQVMIIGDPQSTECHGDVVWCSRSDARLDARLDIAGDPQMAIRTSMHTSIHSPYQGRDRAAPRVIFINIHAFIPTIMHTSFTPQFTEGHLNPQRNSHPKSHRQKLQVWRPPQRLTRARQPMPPPACARRSPRAGAPPQRSPV